MATIPGIMVDIGANVAKMQADMRRLTGTMESGFNQIGSMAKKVGALLAGAFSLHEMINLGKQALETGDRLNKMSQSVGISVESLSVLNYAARLSDLDLQSLAQSAGILSRNMLEAQAGTGEAAEAFSALRITLKDTSGNLLSSDKVMGQIADKFAGMEDGAIKTALAMKLFGRAGKEMIPLLNQGSAGLTEMRAEAEKLGLIMSQETAQRMELVNDNFTRMKMAIEGIAIQVMTGLLPTLDNLTKMLVEAAKEEKDFTDASDGVAAILKIMATAGVVAWASLKDLGQGLGGLAAAFYSAAIGDFRTAYEILKMQAGDSDKIWIQAAKNIEKIWSKSADDVAKAGDKMKKSFAPPPALMTEEQKQIEKRIKALYEEIEAMQMGADALDLFKKGFHNATQEQKEYALYLMRLIDAQELEKKALLDRVKAEEEDQKQIQESEKAIYDMVDSLKMQAIATGMSEEETFKFQLTLKGASKSLIENAEAYFKAIRAAKEYGDEIEILRGLIEETKSPMDRYQERMKQIQFLLSKGWISPEKALQAEKIAWDKMIGGEKDTVAERERILIDFGDRVRAQNLFTADYAIEQIDRQAAIFKAAGADDVAVAFWAAKEKQKASREWEDGAIRGLENYAAEATNAAKNVETVISNSFRGMEDALVEFVKTGKLNFHDLIDSMITDLIRLMIRQSVTGPLAGWFSSGLAGIFAGGGTAAPAGGWYYEHGGGIAGMPATARNLPAFYLSTAPRLHAGLQPDEFPAILQRGEGVFTPEQMKAMGGQTNISISIPVTAGGMDNRQTGRMRRDLEGELEPVVRRIVERYV